MGGFEQRKIVGYKDTELLLDKMRPYTDVILKGEMKLPAKQYQIREVKSTAEQIRACKELAREMTTELAGETITVQNTLEAMLRYQQIAGGHLPDGTRLGKIPKLTELLALLEEFDGKAIIWARYLPEVSLIAETLDKIYPDSVIIITGDVPPPDRQPLVDIFQENPTKRWLVANQATASKGLTITAATLAVYYSNTFSLEDREQSEDRNHRHGQHNEVMYIDLISDLKVDKTVVTAIANKKDVADYVKENLRGDGLQPF
jgi:SNF2 family DNA or RNA helicase